MMANTPRGGYPGQHGAALLLALLGTLMLSLTLLFAAIGARTSAYGRAQPTALALAQAKAALIGYAAAYRDDTGHTDKVLGYLPCPDTNNSGEAAGSCGDAGNTMIGRLPYKTLGLPEPRAAEGECLWYVVSGSHKNNPKSPVNWDTRGKIRVENGNSAALIDPGDGDGGAVAVIIAPGPPLDGQNRPSGNKRCGGDTSNSIAQYLDGNTSDNYAESTPGVLTVVAGQPESSTHNDRIAWISARELYAPIAKRKDLLVTKSGVTLLAEIKSCLDSQSQLALPSTPAARANGQSKVVFLGKVEKLDYLSSQCPTKEIDSAAWSNWKNQIGYVVCNDQTVGCLSIDTQTCRGALVFSGRQADGKPRASNADFESAAGNTFFEEPNLTSYLGAGTIYSGASVYNGSMPAKDVVVCLKP